VTDSRVSAKNGGGRVHRAELAADEIRARRLTRITSTSRTSQSIGAPRHKSASRTAEDSRRHNLPSDISSFIGRQQESIELIDLLGTNRLITLTGVGGAGKTRLALRVAAEVERTYSAGAWIADLASVSDPALILGTVASVLGVYDQPGRSLVATLTEALRERHLLLVLDNCEHLVEASADLAGNLLRSCPRLSILATSRVPLGCSGELTWQVRPLSLPTIVAGTAPPLAEVESSEAVQLFVDRARHAAPNFALTEQNALTVARICQRLDGVPLALELAAARINVLDAGRLLERLNDRFRVLTGGARDRPPRQQTLRAAVQWSYDLLEPPERILLERLSVFAGGLTPEAAEAVCGYPPLPRTEVFDLLAHLVDKSLVTPESIADGAARHRLLETLRQFAADRLSEGEVEELGVRHATYFMSLAQEAELHLWGHEQGNWLAKLDAELDNLRSALQWCIDHAAADTGLRLAAALQQYWDGRGRLTEGKAWLDRLPLHDPTAPAKPRLLALRTAAYLARAQGNFDEGRTLGEQRKSLAEAEGDNKAAAWALHHLGVIAHISGDTARARDLYGECLARFQRSRCPTALLGRWRIWESWRTGQVRWKRRGSTSEMRAPSLTSSGLPKVLPLQSAGWASSTSSGDTSRTLERTSSIAWLCSNRWGICRESARPLSVWRIWRAGGETMCPRSNPTKKAWPSSVKAATTSIL
jgi:non-specific serine/threonine protein kinase